jgi:hypothetical protein
MGAGSTIASEQSKKDFKASFKPEKVGICGNEVRGKAWLLTTYNGHFLNTHEPYQIAECTSCGRHVLRTGYYIDRTGYIAGG